MTVNLSSFSIKKRWQKNLNFVLFLVMFQLFSWGCSRTASVSLESESPSATGGVKIQYSNYFTGGFRETGKYIYFFQQQSAGHNLPQGYSHTVFLKAIGGTIQSGSKSAYTWQVSGLPAWLELQEDSASFILKAISLPTATGETAISITAKSNENKQASVSVKLVVLNNAQTVTGTEPTAINAYSGTNTLRSSENETASADRLNTGGDTDANGACTLAGGSFQTILPSQEISAYSGPLAHDCYAFHVPVSNFLAGFSIRSMETDTTINGCAIALPTAAACASVILIQPFAPFESGYTDIQTANMSLISRDTGLYFFRRDNDSSFHEIAFLGNSVRSPFLEKVSSTPLIWRISMTFDDQNAMLGDAIINRTQSCDPNKSYSNFEADTLCLDNPTAGGNQAWYLTPGWYFLRIKSLRNTTPAANQRYSIKYEIDLN